MPLGWPHQSDGAIQFIRIPLPLITELTVLYIYIYITDTNLHVFVSTQKTRPTTKMNANRKMGSTITVLMNAHMKLTTR